LTRKFSWISAILALPLLGWIALAPLLVISPIYGDEFEWKRTTARLFLDGGKLQYFFPECSKGRLLESPISWYPLQLVHAAMYADMTNPQILRYWGIVFFLALIAYCTWFVRFHIRPESGILATTGAILAPLSIGVLPFLMVLNRPEQSLLLILTLACTLPLVLDKEASSPAKGWLLALLFAMLSCAAVASHIKGIFLLPLMLLCAYLSIRDWRPTMVVFALSCFGAFQTFKIWSARTDCPESPFLVDVFRNQSISPYDLQLGLWSLLNGVLLDIRGIKDYWRATGFQQVYQGDWLPAAQSPRMLIETALNACVPILMVVAVVIVVRASAAAVNRAARRRQPPDAATVISACLLVTFIAIAAFQKSKNFYESSLTIPILGLAVLLGLPAYATRQSRLALACLCGLAVISQIVLAVRFYPHLAPWRHGLVALASDQQRVRSLVARCGVKIDSTTSRLLMDYTSYTVLWPTREPYLIGNIDGWWGTGLDMAHVIQDAKISGAVGACRPFIKEHWPSVISDGAFCCTP
jgi:hypothetical protein